MLKKYWYLFLIAGAAILIFGGKMLYDWGAKTALKNELAAVNNALANTSSRTNPDVHLKLIARKTYLEQTLSNL